MLINQRRFGVRLLTVAATALAGACGLWACEATPETETDKPPSAQTADVQTKAAKPPAAAPLRVNVFLEYSGGMRGFVPAGNAATAATEFQRRVGSLLTETEVSPDVTGRNYFLVYKDTALQRTPFNKMRDVVLGLQAQAALGTELPDMLGAILRRPQAASEVSVIISDFIYGPQIKAKIPLIADFIRTAVNPVTRQKLAVAVLGERSAFVGTYHPAVKTPVKQRQLHGEKVPYYIWVIGPPALVSKYLGQVVKSLPTEQMYLGFASPAVSYAPVLGGFLPGSTLPPKGAHIEFGDEPKAPLVVEDFKETAFLEFSVAFDLHNLPMAWQEPAFLVQNLQAKLPGASARLQSVRWLTLPERDSKALGRFSHIVRVRLEKLPEEADSQLTLALPAPGIPTWVAQWSTTDDNSPGPNANTYRLTDVLGGVRGAFPIILPNVFTTTIALSNR